MAKFTMRDLATYELDWCLASDRPAVERDQILYLAGVVVQEVRASQ